MDLLFAGAAGVRRCARVRHGFSAILLALVFNSVVAETPSGSTASSASEPILEVISAEDFGALPFMKDPKLSPNGTLIAARGYVGGTQRLVVIAVNGDTSRRKGIPIPDKHDLRWFRWAGNDRLLLSVGMSQMLYGEDLYVTRLMVMDLSTDQIKFVGKRTQGIVGDDVLYVHPDGHSLLLSIQETLFDYPSVWDVDLATLKMKRVVKPQTSVWDWFADSSGIVRAGIGVSGQRWWLVYRKDEASRFERVFKRNNDDAGNDGDVERFFFIDGGDRGYVIANKPTGRYGLYQYDFKTDTIGEPVFVHPSVDLDFVTWTETGAVEAVHYTDDRARIEWFEPTMREVQKEIDEALPNRINRVVSMSRDRERMLIWTGTASDPGVLYFYEPAAGMMKLLAKPYEKITGRKLAAVETTSYRARDGLEIPAYLTLPRGRATQALPLIVMPHGGPFARDEWTYDTWAQFLANRGYLVLQPNFRGSTGYGKAFVAKGQGEWGRGMQDDIDDGVKWLVEQGKADPKRVCIMGASFGGYAAMWAAARNPDLYRCAVSFAGISDVEAMLRYDRKLFSATRYYRNWREVVQGDKKFDLTRVSPLRSVESFQIPILIAHGKRDENVPPVQSQKLHDALTKINKPHEFVIYEGEGHGFQDPANHADFLRRVETFLMKYNPADAVMAGK